MERESTTVDERATKEESTRRRERAMVQERTIMHERATKAKSTRTAERAIK